MFILRFIRKFIVLFLTLVLGILIGAYFASKVQPRQFLNIKQCSEQCFDHRQLLGLLGSIGIQYGSDLIPGVVLETDKTVVIKHPKPATKHHYVVIPKKDIKNIGEVEEGDQEYINDAMAAIGEVVRKEKLESYRVITNGPGYQSVAYLHFHIMANKP